MSKVLLTVAAIITLFFAVRYLVEGFTDVRLSPREFNDTGASQQPDDREVSPGGPSSPSVAAPVMPTTFAPPEVPHDPYENTDGKLHVVESLRYPERSFGPGVENTDTLIASASGVASDSSQQVYNSFRVFSPENAQTGGYVDQNIVANDTLDEHAYSPF